MAGEGIFCAGCGITLRPFMKVCPRCSLERENAEPIAIPPHSPEARGEFAAPPNQPALQDIFLPPGETRFPFFTSAQRALAAIGVVLLMMLLAIAYLLWRQQRRDLLHLSSASSDAAAVMKPNPSPSVSIRPDAVAATAPSAPETVDDQKIAEGVNSALLAYNPLGSGRYKVEVSQGVVTLKGEALHQPEKDGASNVIRLVAGVKSVVNNLKVKTEEPPFFPPKVNAAEANLLDNALNRQIAEAEEKESAKERQPRPDEQREAERQKGEMEAARQEELALRKAAEEKLRRESEEDNKREEEMRRAVHAKVPVSTLRTGTVAWSGVVDGVDEIIFSGSSSSVKHMSGKPPRQVRASFSAPIPRSPVQLDLVSTSGRGAISIAQQPSSANGYTAIVRIDDSSKGSEKPYEFTLRWTLP